MKEQIVYYCPVQVCRFPNTTLEQMGALDDLYEEWFLREHEMSVDTEAKEMICENIDFSNTRGFIGGSFSYADEYKQLDNILEKADSKAENISDRLWLRIDLELPSADEIERMRGFLADRLEEYGVQPWQFQHGDDSYMAFVTPYDYFNQTVCSAPSSQSNAVLTEEELKDMISGKISECEEFEMGGIT